MELKTRIYLLTAFLVLILFSQVSNAIIITNYTAFYEDGSKLVVDLKGYDYGKGSYYAAPNGWDERTFPPVEGFDTFFYPSWSLQKITNGIIKPGRIGRNSYTTDGLYFNIDEYYGVAMTSFLYLFAAESWAIVNNGINIPYLNYYTEFSGGFFKTAISPYPVSGPGSLALMIIRIAGLGLVR